jgi:Beta-galactosidase
MLAHRTLRQAILALRAAPVLAGLLWLAPNLAMAQPGYALKPVPYGLGAVIKNDPAQPLDIKPFANPFIRMVALQIHWSDIEPAPGKFNWERLDQFFNAAQTSRKPVHLYVFAGFWSPAWALEGATFATFRVQYGPGAGQKLPLPMPWDPVYLANWFAFLKQLSERYGDRPEFLMIGAAGPTSVSEEFTEPGDPTAIATWLENHYTATKYIGAWHQTFQTYARLFPNQYISLSHGNGLPIDAEGAFDPTEPERTGTAVEGEAWSTLGAQFAFQSSSLTGDGHHAAAIQNVVSYNGRVVTGFQTASSCLSAPSKMGAAGNPPLALTLTIQNGVQRNPINGLHADFIEIHSEDVEAEQMQPVLRWAASLFD